MLKEAVGIHGWYGFNERLGGAFGKVNTCGKVASVSFDVTTCYDLLPKMRLADDLPLFAASSRDLTHGCWGLCFLSTCPVNKYVGGNFRFH